MENLFSYTNRNMEAARQEGLSKIPIISRGDWTDLNATDPGIILLDYVHALVDMVNFYQDHQALESFISTAKERKNIFRLAKQLSYKIRSAKGATVDVEFYTEELYGATIKIPKHTHISTGLSSNNTYVSYLTAEDAYILAGESRVIIPCIQGEIGSFNYTGTGISRFSDIAYPFNQSYILNQKNIDIDSIEIIDNLNRVWQPVDYITFSEAKDRVYQKDLNPDGSVTIKFGDGERGVVPQVTDVLNISYVYSLAEEGRVGANTLTTIRQRIFDINGNLVDIKVNNPESSTGGSSVPTDSEITDLAPGSIKAQDRAVTLKDFENLARTVDGVGNAKAYDINTAPDLCLYHEVKVVIIPTGNNSVNTSLVKRVYDYLYDRMIPPTNLQVLAPSEVQVDISVRVQRDLSYAEGGLEYAIRECVEDFFKEQYKRLGEPFESGELIALINKIPGVRYVESITPARSPEMTMLSTCKLGKIDIQIS